MSLQLPISVKGVIIDNERVLLLKNERKEWELPGGRLERGETPETCVIREIREETGIICSVDALLDVWVYKVFAGHEVFVVTYRCRCEDASRFRLSSEHQEYQWLPLSEVEQAYMPQGYKDVIRKAG
ncbi:NUDIX hydrolase [Brevibacillus massiliensis]|jgi:mutator protein MutT|uniref:NUDIX hydrolase n=1 Tax=Brevibacillus massiliensis TaxID=1118054 RepID=UPI00030122B5|nr:NUDIX hydrolase [Brevibacillus massiliensis]